jgi:hypothetical protein
MLDYTYKPRYREPQYLNIIIHHKDGTIITKENYDCCECVKTNTLYNKTAILTKIKPVNFSIDETNRWLKLLESNDIKIGYEIDNANRCDKIIINYDNYYNNMHLYLCLIFVRYLWYHHNDGLIDRIFHILDNSTLNFWQALVLAHYYDNPVRNEVFNLTYKNIPLTYHIFRTYDYNFINFVKSMDKVISINKMFFDYLNNSSIIKEYFKLNHNIITLWNYVQENRIKHLISNCKTYTEANSILYDKTAIKSLLYEESEEDYYIEQFVNNCKKVDLKLNLNKSQILEKGSEYLFLNTQIAFEGQLPFIKYTGQKTSYGMVIHNFSLKNNKQKFVLFDSKLKNKTFYKVTYEN